MEINFKKVEESRAGKVYLRVVYFGGDADTTHPEEYLLKDITFDNVGEKTAEIAEIVKPYAILDRVLEEYSDYQSVLEEYGEDVARLYDNAPNDPQCDYQFKCHLDYLELVGYDASGAKHESSINLR